MQGKALDTLIVWFVFAYFLILFLERTQSVVRSGLDKKKGFFSSGFHAYVNLITILSLLGTVLLLILKNRGFFTALAGRGQADLSWLAVTCGVILVSGMVHTEYTAAPVQFVAYGFLIAAMILRTVQAARGAAQPFHYWYSLVYVTAFSMAIPVMYRSKIKHAAFFHVIEAVTALALVFCFTMMLRALFLGKGEDLLWWVPMLTAFVCDSAILLMRRKEEINTFVLIFLIVSCVLFCAGRILFPLIG